MKFCFQNALSLEKNVKIIRCLFIPDIAECTHCVKTSSLTAFSFLQTSVRCFFLLGVIVYIADTLLVISGMWCITRSGSRSQVRSM